MHSCFIKAKMNNVKTRCPANKNKELKTLKIVVQLTKKRKTRFFLKDNV